MTDTTNYVCPNCGKVGNGAHSCRTDTNIEKAREWLVEHPTIATLNRNLDGKSNAREVRQLAALLDTAVVEGLRMAANDCASGPAIPGDEYADRIRALADELEGK